MSETVSVQNEIVKDPKDVLARCIELNRQKTEAKKILEAITAEFDKAKEQVKDLFIEMGVRSMKAGKTVYLSKQIWAGNNEGVTNIEVTKALESLDLAGHVTYNHQSVSSYVREIVKEHVEWFDEDGGILVDPDILVQALPEPLNKLLKVTEKIDIKVRN